MLQSSTEFFKNLPKKECPECGQIVEEQHESYIMECDHCLRQEKNKGKKCLSYHIKDAASKGDKTPFDAASFFIK